MLRVQGKAETYSSVLHSSGSCWIENVLTVLQMEEDLPRELFMIKVPKPSSKATN